MSCARVLARVVEPQTASVNNIAQWYLPDVVSRHGLSTLMSWENLRLWGSVGKWSLSDEINLANACCMSPGANPKFLDHGRPILPLTRALSAPAQILLSTSNDLGKLVPG